LLVVASGARRAAVCPFFIHFSPALIEPLLLLLMLMLMRMRMMLSRQ